MVQKPLSLRDLEAYDPTLYKSLARLLAVNVDDLGLVFADGSEELVPGGMDLDVTDENKHEYVRLLVKRKLEDTTKEQLSEFLRGLHDIVNQGLLSFLSPEDLEVMVNGAIKIDFNDLKENIVWRDIDDTTKEYTLQVLQELSQDEMISFLQFATGSPRIPLGGFHHLPGAGKLTFETTSESLPRAHTCYSTVELPQFSSIEECRKAFKIVVTYGCEGFGFS
eukprot:TRINITY_DN357_c0_g1_i4.p1 TRINITY_DN357_c0_g1~~TRINITY_DN357_c0_g1_i4.p1  ORF type:complete len:244 (+),score=58.69 TRINITY_DN357_c0_g1_i4:67-732(+)